MRLANLLTGAAARAARRRVLARRTERELRQLAPEQLQDIGVHRNDLRAFAWELAWQRIPEEGAANDRTQPPSDGRDAA